MAHSGSAFSASSNAICDARYQNECWYSIARSKCFCASGLHEVSKWTFPSLLSSDCATAGWASEMPAATTDTKAALRRENGSMADLSLSVRAAAPGSAADEIENPYGAR